MTVWDPVSKQPYFKTAACRVTKVASRRRPRAGADHHGLRSRPRRRGHPPAPDATAAGGAARTSSHVLDETPHYALDPSQEDLMPHLATYVCSRRPQREDPGGVLPRRRRRSRPAGRRLPHLPHPGRLERATPRRLAPVVERYGEQDDVDEPERLTLPTP